MTTANLATVGLTLAQTPPTNQSVETTGQPADPNAAPVRPPTTRPWWGDQTFLPLLIALAFLYFFVFRSKSKKEKERTQMLGALKKGDRIQTIGGVLGTVVEASEDEVVVKVDESSNAKITFLRSAIHRVREEAKK